MSRNQTEPIDDGKRPVPRRALLYGVLVAAAVALIVGIAVYNLRPAPQTAAPAPRDGENSVSLAAPSAPSFDVVRISRGGTGVLAGRAEPGSRVEVYASGEPVGAVTADRNGEWVLILEEPLEPGTVELSLLAQGRGEQPLSSDEVVVVSIPEPAEPERFAEREGEGVVAVLIPRAGDGASRVMQKPGLAAPGEVGDNLTVDTIDYGAEGRAIFTGRALPRTEVRVYLDNDFIGEARVDDEGQWQVMRGDAPAPGNHVLRVDQVIEEGDVQLRVMQPFETGAPVEPALAESAVVIQPGNTLWAIARRLYGRGTRYTLIFQENSERIADPDLIYPNQVFELPAQEPSADAG